MLIVLAIGAIVIISLVVLPMLAGPGDPAVKIALSDPDVKSAIAQDQGNYKVTSVLPQSQNDRSGYIDVNDSLVTVSLSMQGKMYGPDSYVAFVDLNQSKVIGGEWYSYRGFHSSWSVTLPPGASYYHGLSGVLYTDIDSSGNFSFSCSLVNLTPGDATIFPVLVDWHGLSQLKNGSSYSPVTYYDTYAHKSVKLDGSTPVSSGWTLNASCAYEPGQGYFLVMKNNGTEPVSMAIDNL